METVKIEKVVPDENQPRKYFDAAKLHSLKESIKKHGIKNPLVVQKTDGGKYLLIDGERRYRAATELKLKEIPVIIEDEMTDVERLVVQFNIQEQHESWTPVEKAHALINIAKSMGVSLSEALIQLNIERGLRSRYLAFAALSDKENFARSNVAANYAPSIVSVRNAAKRLSDDADLEFNHSDEKKLEGRIVQLILDGEVKRPNDVVRIKDSFVKNPKLIMKFISTNITNDELYKESKAKGAFHLRNVINHAQYTTTHVNSFMKTRDVKLTPAQVVILKQARAKLQDMINLAE
ncbi:MAG: ParB/RepB/Spo0J family partition protein [Candidatus Paceibacterota bacterium]|jgi:ParB/RepB/Spo0J family partition protein